MGSSGEIVQVQGGHIIRATGRKDRHSKVYTAKGPRDRRVRLSAHTAIQFYDVQDRLGYDRPSKAVDWLMKKAKSAIDKLDHLPPFDPVAANAAESASAAADAVQVGPPGLGSCTGDEINQFHAAGFHHGYPHQDLCLSLHSFQNPGLVHGSPDPGHPNSDSSLYGFEAGSSSGAGGGGHWQAPVAEPGLGEMGQFSRLLAWNGGGGGVYGGGDRGSLQPSYDGQVSSSRAWDHLPMDQHRIPKTEMQMQQQQQMARIGVLGSDGFMGYCVPSHGGSGGGGGDDQDVHGITVAYHHNNNSVSSMSTDSSR